MDTYNENFKEDSVERKIRRVTDSMQIPIDFIEFLIEQEQRILNLENKINKLKEDNNLFEL